MAPEEKKIKLDLIDKILAESSCFYRETCYRFGGKEACEKCYDYGVSYKDIIDIREGIENDDM